MAPTPYDPLMPLPYSVLSPFPESSLRSTLPQTQDQNEDAGGASDMDFTNASTESALIESVRPDYSRKNGFGRDVEDLSMRR